MKAILVSEPSKFELTSIPEPSCGPGEVIVRTAYCGICGTDLEILRGSMPPAIVRYPVVPGHEWTGVVEEVGRGVERLKVGDRVSVEGYLSCGNCLHCRAGEINLCESHEQIGLTSNGGFSEFVRAPAHSCHAIPSDISLEEAVLVEPAATVVRGFDRARIKPGVSAAVIGCGPVGQIAARLLQAYEPKAILGIDLAEVQRSIAVKAGITEFTTSQDVNELRQLSGIDGWDLVVNCARGARALELSFSIVRRGGTVLFIGGASELDRLILPANQLLMNDLQVEGVCGYTSASWVKTLTLLDRGSLSFQGLVTHRLPLEQFQRGTELLESRSEPSGKVMICFK